MRALILLSICGSCLAIATLSDLPSLLQRQIQVYLPAWINFAAPPTVTIAQGQLLGTFVDDGTFPTQVEVFLGIPYALPPVGELRFARPQPVPPSNQTVVASRYGPSCPGRQLLRIPGLQRNSEDCLTANVFRHANTSGDDKLPVAVYVHGGAFNRGSSKMHNTASMVAWSTEPFIAVSFNYRIGAPGFLNSALTENEGLLNLGLRDQILLLEWVQDNIAAFGGNPEHVTLIGVSAGAHSIGHHMMNINQDKRLFHQAIMESGGPTSRALHPYHSQLHQDQFNAFLHEVNCHKSPLDRILPCLRQVPSAKLIRASNAIFTASNPSLRWAFQPVIDNDIISRRPLSAWASGEYQHIPILTGFNTNEGSMYVSQTANTPSTFTNFFTTLLPQLSLNDLHTFAELYPDPSTTSTSPYTETRPIRIGKQFKRLEAAYGQYAYVCPVRQTARLASSTRSSPPVYMYHWATNISVLSGANHADQTHYETMDPDVRRFSSTQEQIAAWFHAYVTSFIVSGDPNAVRGRGGEGRPKWEAFRGGEGERKGEEKGKTMVFGLGNDERAGGVGLGVVAELVEGEEWAREECGFWWGQSENYED